MSNTELVAIPLLLGLCALLSGWFLPAKIRLAFTLVGWFAALVITLALVSLLQPSQLAYRLDAPSHNKLAEQARQELRKLEIPVKIRFYSSADAAQASHEWRQNARLVGKVLQQIVEHNPSMLQLEVIAPAADSLEEQQALAEGMQSQQYNNHDLWCGISLRALDRQRQFKLLKNTNAALLEQQLLSAIHELGRWNAPRIGVLSSFKLLNAKPQSHSDESWLVRSQLTRRYQVETLDLACTHIPEHLDTLLVLHPSNISTPTLQALEKFLQRGGKLVACLDAYSVMAASLRQEMPPQMLPQLPRQASGLGELLKHWGVEFQFGKIVADPLYASDISNQTQLPSLLSLGSGAFTDGQITSSGLEDVFLVLSGGFELKQPQNWQVLAKASDEAFWQSWNEASAQQKERRPDSPSAAGTALFITSSAALPCYFSPGQYSSPQAKVWLLGDCDFLANDYAYNIERNQSGIVSARQSNHNLNLLYARWNRVVNSTNWKPNVACRRKSCNNKSRPSGKTSKACKPPWPNYRPRNPPVSSTSSATTTAWPDCSNSCAHITAASASYKTVNSKACNNSSTACWPAIWVLHWACWPW